MIRIRPILALKFIVAIFVFAALGYVFFKNHNDKFPDLGVTGKMDVFSLGHSIPMQKICSLDGPLRSEEFIAALSKRYPDNWSRPAPISFATSYLIVSENKNTEISILKGGLIIVTTNGTRNKVVARSLKPGEYEEVVSLACNIARKTQQN